VRAVAEGLPVIGLPHWRGSLSDMRSPQPIRALKSAFAAGLLAAGSGFATASCGPETTIAPTSDFTLTFKVCGDRFVGDVWARATGWVGVGFSTDQYMPETDVFMGGVLPDGTTYGTDRFAYFRSPPVEDGQQDVTLLGASESDGITTYSFSRPLSTNDPMDFDLAVGSYYILTAFNASSDSLTQRHTYADASDFAYSFAPVPELPSLAMLLAGLGLLASRVRRAGGPA
jgi:hypothetical protein